MKKSVFIALFLSLAIPAGASPITVAAGHTVLLTFGTNPGNWDPTDPPDYLEIYLNVNSSDWLGGINHGVDVALYDGDRLLGSRVGTGVPGASFLGAGTELPRDWQPGNTWPLIDFTSLLDGTIDGRLEISPVAGAFRFDPAGLDLRSYSPDYIGPHPVMLMDVLADGGFWAARGDFDWIRDPRIDVTRGNHAMDIATPVPEPGTLTLLATGLGIGALRFRKRRQRRQEDAPAL